MYISRDGLSDKENNRFENLVMESFKVLNELIGIDETEDIYFEINGDFRNEFGRTINLLGFRHLYRLSSKNANDIFDKYSGIKYDVCSNYETMIVINKEHINKDDDCEIVNTLIHEILHHLTNEEEDAHGNKWNDLAKYVSENSIYHIDETATKNNGLKG